MHPITNKPCTVPINGWRYTQRKMKELIADDFILFGRNKKLRPDVNITRIELGLNPIPSHYNRPSNEELVK